MPLYIDLHTIDSDAFTEIDIYKAHLKDVAVQNKFGLVYKKYYLNLAQKTACCLMEGPSIEACVASHKEAHGIGACNVIEVSPKFEFHPYMGEGSKNDKDLALTLSGEIDTGYRTLMMVCLADFTGEYGHFTNEIHQLIQQYQGSKINQPNDKIMASFIHATDAISCCLASSYLLKTVPQALDYTMALVTGKPVDEVGSNFFGEAKARLQMLCRIGHSKVIYADWGTKALIRKGFEMPAEEEAVVKFVSTSDFLFYEALWEILDSQVPDPDFNSGHLCKRLGLSKAQAYRKIKALTGMSPNTLIREMRLRRSLSALKKNNKNVAEIAYELGFNSPSYFTRVFRNRYNILPTSFANLSSGST